MNIIDKKAFVLELKGASGAIGLRVAQSLAKHRKRPVLFRYSKTQINGVYPDGRYQELERDTWRIEDPTKPFRYLPGKNFAGVSDFDRQMQRLS